MIPDSVVDEVRSRADIVELVGEHVPLKRKGRDYWAPCPFHKEKTPSFHVVPDRGFFKCFGCGESGDAFSFLMKHLGLTFQDAVRHVAARVGVEIPDSSSTRAADDPHRALYEAVAFAAEFYRRQLWEERAGERARRYLEGRGIGRAAAERFQLGYAPDDWRALRTAAARHGIDDAVLLEAGLVKTSDRSDEPYDRLRDRIIFPITDGSGRIIAFGGRILGAVREGAPKYLNSPETPIYQKGRHLYGLAWAKGAIRREGAVLVVEGYMDYVSLAARGIENVVAGLGTAMTVDQAALVARYTRQALLLYDSDPAGLRATFRTADALLAAGVHPLVVTLPPGEDPDSVARGGGAEALRPYLDAAVDVLDRKLRILEERGYFESAEGTRKALDGLLPTLRAATDAALRDIYVARVAERTGVRRETLEAELRPDRWDRPSSSGWLRVGGEGHGGQREGGGGRRPSVVAGLAGQRTLVLLLLRDESRIGPAAEVLAPESFADPVYREIYEMLVREGGLRGRNPAAVPLGDAARERLEALLSDPEELSDGDRIFDDAVRAIRADTLYRRLDELDLEIPEARARGDEEALRALTLEKMGIMYDLRALGYFVERLIRKQGRANRNHSTRDG